MGDKFSGVAAGITRGAPDATLCSEALGSAGWRAIVSVLPAGAGVTAACAPDETASVAARAARLTPEHFHLIFAIFTFSPHTDKVANSSHPQTLPAAVVLAHPAF
jgi:hypothetical protein